jgi:hypothetical protein
MAYAALCLSPLATEVIFKIAILHSDLLSIEILRSWLKALSRLCPDR